MQEQLSEQTLRIAEKRRKEKSKGEGKKYTQLNAESQRIGQRDKNTFLNEQCKEIEENNRIGRIRDIFKKIRDTNGIFHARVGPTKDRKCKDLTEAEKIKKRCKHHRTIQKRS